MRAGQRALAVLHGYRVLTPFGVNHRYDFALDMGDRFLRVQCKTGRLRDGVIRYAAKSTRVNTQRTFSRGYAGEIDVFAVYCPETNGTYIVPMSDVAATRGWLRIDPTANRQERRIRWAKDYLLPA